MSRKRRQWLYLNLSDWTWWIWTLTTGLLIVGLTGHHWAFLAAIGLTAIQAAVFYLRERKLSAFGVQLRLAYLLLLLIAYPSPMRWLYWLPAAGTAALVIFGYCLLARCLSLLPWNSREPYTWSRLRRTFFSAPDLGRVPAGQGDRGCAGGLCTIAAQVAPANDSEH